MSSTTVRDYEPGPVKRALMVKAAAKLVGKCPACGTQRPLDPGNGICWPCGHLVSATYPNAATDRQRCAPGESCNDCAFKAGSPEGNKLSPAEQLAVMHVGMPGDRERSPETTRDIVMMQAMTGTAIFWCHKPFLETSQQWGWDSTKREMIPLYGPHWKPCAAWGKIFDKTFGVKKP